MGLRWPWRRKVAASAPDEMAAAAHAGALAQDVARAEGGAPQRLRLRYAGKVQAVGFRFQAQLLAKSAGCVGWVQNLDDGDVLVEVQGTPSQLEAFRLGIQDLSNSPDIWISCRLVSQVAVPLAQGEKDFRVRY